MNFDLTEDQKMLRDTARSFAKKESPIERKRKMSETDQAIFIHCGLEGQSASHAAAFVSLSRDAVLKRWQRLRERLRTEVPEGERLVLDLD